MKRNAKLLVGIFFCLCTFFLYTLSTKKVPDVTSIEVSPSIEKTAIIDIHTQKFEVVIADTIEKRTQGLSGTKSIPKDGMLFVFEKPSTYSFWMKDMKYPLDIIFFDDQKKIVGLFNTVLPTTYPTTFRPEKKSLYVLEVASGFIAKHNLLIGDNFDFTYTK